MNGFIVKNSTSTQQINEEDYIIDGYGIIEPYIDYSYLRQLYFANLYHQRAIKIKAGILSQIKQSNLNRYLPPNVNAKRVLYKFILNLETYGSAFLEKAGVSKNFVLYNMNTHNTRVDKENNIYQVILGNYNKIEAIHLKYDSILSDFYGEPDYISILRQIATLFKADERNNLFFENGGKPELAWIFEDSDPSSSQIDAITQFAKKEFGGYKNAHKNIILTTGAGDGQTKPKIRIEQIGKIEDMSFSKLKEVGRDEIATAHGVPPRLLGIVQGNGLGGQGELVAQMKMFLATTINPKIELIEWFFKEEVGIELEIDKFDIETLNSKDDKSIAKQLVKAGVITEIEKRNILGVT